MTRACGALSFQEEKHVLLAKAHLALAASCRLASVEESRWALGEATDDLLEAEEDLYACCRVASPEVLADRATMLVVLRADGSTLEFCGPDFRGDPEMVLTACQEDGWALEFASPELRANREFVLQAVRLDGEALTRASEDFKGDREIVLAALQSQPVALLNASPELRLDRELLLTALRCHTRRLALTDQVYALASFFRTKEERADKELLLEAARLDGSILGAASPELREDKDFVLEVMRRAPDEDQEFCYIQADESVQDRISLKHFQGARKSVLASAGEDAPVLTVKLPPPSAASAREADLERLPPSSCEVSLLSGTSFTCRLTASEATSASAKRVARRSKRRRTPPPSLTVSQLAEQVKAELLVHLEANPPPARVFIVFNKLNAEGEDLSVPVTPWDWDRPIADFS